MMPVWPETHWLIQPVLCLTTAGAEVKLAIPRCFCCCCRFVNVEAVPETADINNRYEQVTLFRAHRHLVQPGAQPYR